MTHPHNLFKLSPMGRPLYRLISIVLLALFGLVLSSVSVNAKTTDKPTPALNQNTGSAPSSEATASQNILKSSYELFWPIVAGRVAGEPFYFLKTLKEDIAEKLIFADIRKSDHHLFLSKKRLVETEKLLLEKKDYRNAVITIQKSVSELQNAIQVANLAKRKGKKVQDLFNALSKDGDIEAGFLENLIKQIPEEQKGPFDKAVFKIRELVKSL